MSVRKRSLFVLGLLLLLLLLTLLAAPAAADNARSVSVMTQNAYVGADMVPALLATNYEDFLSAVGLTYQQAINSKIPARGAAIAVAISAAQPDLVGLQEVALWRSGPSGPAPATVVEADMLAEIMDDLGTSYTVLAKVEGFDGEYPTASGLDVRLTNYDVLLARADVPGLKLTNIRSGTYRNRLVIPSFFAGLVVVPRQWVSVDVQLRGSKVRVITTHLEAALQSVRVAQAAELVNGPARTRRPVIVVGDLNAEVQDVGDSAWLLLEHGFVDAWAIANPGVSGPTCCQSPTLGNDVSQLSERIDLVLSRGDLQPATATVVGAEPLSAGPPYWLSDHAGVTAELLVFK